MRISELYYQFKPNLVFCLALPVYVILFVTIFSPSLSFYDGWSQGWDNSASLCLPIMAAIELVTVLLSRCILCFVPFSHTLSKTEYFIWMLFEMIITSLFLDLFLSILLHRPYFDLLPSAMLSTVSALCAQNAGAGRHDRSRQVLRIGCMICAGFGAVIFALCQPLAPWIVSLFVRNGDNVETVVRLGGQYLRTYSVDCMIAGIHFCFSGFFSAYGKSVYSFLHNMISIITFRIPGAWLAAVYFPATLYPMGLAAPMGSLLSVLICLFLYRRIRLND